MEKRENVVKRVEKAVNELWGELIEKRELSGGDLVREGIDTEPYWWIQALEGKVQVKSSNGRIKKLVLVEKP